MRKIAILCLALIFFLASGVRAEDRCDSHYYELLIGDKLASAGVFANYWKRVGSVAYESENAFIRALEKVEAGLVPPQKKFCPARCKVRPIAYMYFGSVPNELRKEYSEAEKCDALWSESSAKPYEYELNDVQTLAELTEWISNLSQGSGDAGEDLYSRCSGSCSPQYHYLITKDRLNDHHYRVSAEVQCGHARDKDDNQYRLKYSFRWYCEEA